jgi:hypothetical protein
MSAPKTDAPLRLGLKQNVAQFALHLRRRRTHRSLRPGGGVAHVRDVSPMNSEGGDRRSIERILAEARAALDQVEPAQLPTNTPTAR